MSEQNLLKPARLNLFENKGSYCWLLGGHLKAIRESFDWPLESAARSVDLPEELLDQLEHGDVSYSKETYTTAVMMLMAAVLSRPELGCETLGFEPAAS